MTTPQATVTTRRSGLLVIMILSPRLLEIVSSRLGLSFGPYTSTNYLSNGPTPAKTGQEFRSNSEVFGCRAARGPTEQGLQCVQASEPIAHGSTPLPRKWTEGECQTFGSGPRSQPAALRLRRLKSSSDRLVMGNGLLNFRGVRFVARNQPGRAPFTLQDGSSFSRSACTWASTRRTVRSLQPS